MGSVWAFSFDVDLTHQNWEVTTERRVVGEDVYSSP